MEIGQIQRDWLSYEFLKCALNPRAVTLDYMKYRLYFLYLPPSSECRGLVQILEDQ